VKRLPIEERVRAVLAEERRLKLEKQPAEAGVGGGDGAGRRLNRRVTVVAVRH
jgi:hypothetical protein